MRVYHKCSVVNHLHHNMTNDCEIFASTKEGSESLFYTQDRDCVMVFEISDDAVICHNTGDTGDGRMSAKYYGYDEIICNVTMSDCVEIILNTNGDKEEYLYQVAETQEGLADLFSRLYDDFYALFSNINQSGLTKEFLNF